MSTRRRFLHPLAAIAACSVALGTPAARAGDLNAEVNSMFDSLGAVGNYTAPGAFQGQTYNTFTGGSFYMRAPNKVYQLAAVQMPSAKGGCGGIDVFGGSFSHISAAEFRNMLRNMTAALPGIAFQLAVEAVSPLLGGIGKYMKQLETFINNQRIGSCEAATALVGSAAGALGYDSRKGCTAIARASGLASDNEDANRQCQTNEAGILNTARTGADADLKAMAPFVGNMTWKALKELPGSEVDDQTRELMMSLVGTEIFYPASDNRDSTPIAPTITSVSHLLFGQSTDASGDVVVPVLRCDEYVECRNVRVDANYKHVPISKKVQALLTSISDSIRSRTAIPNNTAAVGLVNSTSIPIWRMLAIGNASPNSAIADTLIASYKDVIAAEYVSNFLVQKTDVAIAALAKKGRFAKAQADVADRIRSDAQRIKADVRAETRDLYTKVAAVKSVTSELETLERNLRTSMSWHVVDMLGYAQSATR